MQVFKLCLKVLKKNIIQMSIYVVVFLVIALIMSGSMSKDQQKEVSFSGFKANIAFISEEETPLIEGFKAELSKIANFKDLPDETEALQDALYFRDVSYILRIPEGFTQKFMNGEEVTIEKTIVPDSISNVYVDLSIDKYFNTAKLYVNNIEGLKQQELVESLKEDLSNETYVEVKTFSEKTGNHTYANYFFNYFVYSLFMVIILGINSLMLVYNNQELKRRTVCSPVKTNSINMQFLLANVLFTLVSWAIMVVFCIIFNLENSRNLNTIYFIANSLVFAFTCSGIGFLIGQLVKGQDAVSAVSNVVCLGSSFISGVFVPQELLGSSVLKIASFTPSYWFVTANNKIAELTKFDFAHIEPILFSMSVQIGFSIAFIAVALVIGKKKRYA